ncbi:hypothetical protein BB558_001872 [Smittium angustum]|uniref:Phosphatidic acid phosphatase type 2/haloperoxidase domain-containing protein n=1 Tax=Smittium angustum TaxID=133377 RepID=A0A2U1JAH1_SMIAN|nr:hypothetical protein BB558_001872 [Smittium angustum]
MNNGVIWLFMEVLTHVPIALGMAEFLYFLKSRYFSALVFFGGQVVCEILNIILKRVWKGGRPASRGKGYGMPSAHSQFMGYFIGYIVLFVGNRLICSESKKATVFWSSAILSVLVSFSRVYLGYHTPWQVIVGFFAGMATALVWYMAAEVIAMKLGLVDFFLGWGISRHLEIHFPSRITIEEPASVTRFRQFFKIQTVHPKPDYTACAEFLVDQADEIGLESKLAQGKQIVIMKLPGTDPSLKSIMLDSHTDVVPVFEEFWTYPPFAATIVEQEYGDHKIYARGSQDMKVTGSMQVFGSSSFDCCFWKETQEKYVYAVFAPDEEIGGTDGIGGFVETEYFKEMSVGFDLEEGLLGADHRNVFLYAERGFSQVTFTSHGNTGHGSQFIEGTAIEKLFPVIEEVMNLREQERQKLLALNDGSLNLK